MEKSEFVARIAKRIDAKSDIVEEIVDATLAEVLAPAVFVQPGERRHLLADEQLQQQLSLGGCAQQPGRGF